MQTSTFTETRTTKGFYIETASVAYIGIGLRLAGLAGYFLHRDLHFTDGVLIGKVKVTKLVRLTNVYSFREVGPKSLRRPVVYLTGDSAVIVEGKSYLVSDFYDSL